MAWPRVKLSDVVEFISTGPFGSLLHSEDYVTGGTPLVNPSNIEDGIIVPDDAKAVDDATLVRLENYRLAEGDVVIARRGELGRCAVVHAEQSGWLCGTGSFFVRPSKRLLAEFLVLVLSSAEYREILEKASTGATMPNISNKTLQELLIPLPPLSEQKRIVAILDEAFEGIRIATANAEKNLANARELFERTVVESVFGDADAKGWRTAYVSDLAASEKGSIRTGPFGSQLLHSEFVDDGIAVLGIDNAVANEFRWAKRRYISPEKFEQLSRYRVKPGDVIITIMGTCGRCAIVPDNMPLAINTKHLCCITLDRKQCLPEYLHAYFLYHPTACAYLAAQSKGAIMEGLNMGIIKEMPVRVPSIETQATIAGQIEDLRMATAQINTTYEERLSNYSLLKQSILARAFSGQLTASKGLAA